MDCDGTRIDIHTRQDVTEFANRCPHPKVLKLLDVKYLPVAGMKTKEFYSFVNASELHMCIKFEQSTFQNLDFSGVKRIERTCNKTDPKLLIQHNHKLKTIKLNKDLMKDARTNDIVIRGNRNLTNETIVELKEGFPWFYGSIQKPGECGLPPVLTTMEALKGCKKVYGTISVTGAISDVNRSQDATGLDVDGCIFIYRSDIHNVDFLDDIEKFTLIPDSCTHQILENDNLCIKRPYDLKKKFVSLSIIQPESCDTDCKGGKVTDVFLEQIDGCTSINGDLIFENFNKRPSRMYNLARIRRINGTLKISSTKSMGQFTMDDLTEITTTKGPAIEITGNSGLKSVSFPKLKKINSPDNIKVKITSNPKLKMKRLEVDNLYSLSNGKPHTRIEFTDNSTLMDLISEYKMYIIMVLLALLILLLLALISAILIAKAVRRRQMYTSDGYPKPPWRLDKKSKEILSAWVKEITRKSPLIWRCSDREIIWPYQKGDGTHKDIEVLVANNASFLKDYMLPLSANGRIPDNDQFLLTERVKSMLSKEVIIMIGAEREPSCVLPNLPHQLKKDYTYKYLGSTYCFTLKRFKKMAPCTMEYTYDTVVTPKNKPVEKRTLKVYYYRWDKRKMPVEYDEILQLAKLYKPEKTVCLSERRKEVFSLIHMLHTYCNILKESIDLKDALQLHTEKCNGTILDRSELLYVMAVLMEWAYQSRSLKPEQKKDHMEWCHTYAIMARFMRSNSNIKLVHPDYLTKLDPKERQKAIHEGFTSSPRFSPRESAPAIDPFHMKRSALEPKEKAAPAQKDGGDKKESDKTGDSQKKGESAKQKSGESGKQKTSGSKRKSGESEKKSGEGGKPETEDDKEFWLKKDTIKPTIRKAPSAAKDRIAI